MTKHNHNNWMKEFIPDLIKEEHLWLSEQFDIFISQYKWYQKTGNYKVCRTKKVITKVKLSLKTEKYLQIQDGCEDLHEIVISNPKFGDFWIGFTGEYSQNEWSMTNKFGLTANEFKILSPLFDKFIDEVDDPCIDNERICKVIGTDGMSEQYKRARWKGCCGSADEIIDTPIGKFWFGCNFGH